MAAQEPEIRNACPWIIVHVPHASRLIPTNVRPTLVLDNSELEKELNKLTDHHTDQLFTHNDPDIVLCKFPVSRIAVDPERFEDDNLEPMSNRGMGVIYTHTSSGHLLRNELTNDQRTDLIERFYHPHHIQLSSLVSEALAQKGHAFIIDGHSFPDNPLPCDLDQSSNRPDICLGTDEFHTPGDLVTVLLRACEAEGWSVEINRPYSGTIIPTEFFNIDLRVSSIMIEVNRRLYLRNEPEDVRTSEAFVSVQQGIQRLIKEAVQIISTIKGGVP